LWSILFFTSFSLEACIFRCPYFVPFAPSSRRSLSPPDLRRAAVSGTETSYPRQRFGPSCCRPDHLKNPFDSAASLFRSLKKLPATNFSTLFCRPPFLPVLPPPRPCEFGVRAPGDLAHVLINRPLFRFSRRCFCATPFAACNSRLLPHGSSGLQIPKCQLCNSSFLAADIDVKSRDT